MKRWPTSAYFLMSCSTPLARQRRWQRGAASDCGYLSRRRAGVNTDGEPDRLRWRGGAMTCTQV
jgi:hypothetical protein